MPEIRPCADRKCGGIAHDDYLLCSDCVDHLYAVKSGHAEPVHPTEGLRRELAAAGLEIGR